MITVIARLKCQAGKEAEAAAACSEMVKGVETNEPGALAYVCHQSKKDPAEIVFFEVYADDAAFAAHRKTEHMMKLTKAFPTLFAGPPDVQFYDRVQGFTR